MAIKTVISDFGGVLTTPLVEAFAAVQDRTGVPMEAIGKAMAHAAEAEGAHPLFELECGRITEAEFLERLAGHLERELGHRPEMHRFGETYFEALEPNDRMISVMRSLADRDYRMALLTNNVREWEPMWRSMLPVDEIFSTIVDSAFVGCRKPDEKIYRLTLGRVRSEPGECLFIDDTEHNCEAAEQLGMVTVHFRENAQAVHEIERALGID